MLSSIRGSIEPEILLATLAATALIAFVTLQLYRQILFQKKYRLPNRVPGIPFFGNSFQVPPVQQGPWAKQMAKKHGEM